MARPVTPLTDPKCDAARPKDKPYKLNDGQGLYLDVRPSGMKVWRLKQATERAGEHPHYRRVRAQGHQPAKARDERRKARDLLAQGIDPAEHARQEEERAQNATTFEAIAREWHSSQLKRGRWSPGHAERVLSEMEAYLFPSLGRRPVEELKTRDLLVPLHEVEACGALDRADACRPAH